MSDALGLDRAARVLFREELSLIEDRLIDRLDWLEERLHWINQQLAGLQEALFPPDPYPSGDRDRPLEAI